MRVSSSRHHQDDMTSMISSRESTSKHVRKNTTRSYTYLGKTLIWFTILLPPFCIILYTIGHIMAIPFIASSYLLVPGTQLLLLVQFPSTWFTPKTRYFHLPTKFSNVFRLVVSNIFNIYPHLGKWFNLTNIFTAGGTWLSDLLRLDGSDNLTNIFQSGWNHQLVLQVLSICVRTFPLKGLFRCQNDLSKKLRSPEVVPMAPRIMSRSCCWPNKFSWSLAFASCFFLKPLQNI